MRSAGLAAMWAATLVAVNTVFAVVQHVNAAFGVDKGFGRHFDAARAIRAGGLEALEPLRWRWTLLNQIQRFPLTAMISMTQTQLETALIAADEEMVRSES